MGEWIYQPTPEVFPWKCSECGAKVDMVAWDGKYDPEDPEKHWVIRRFKFCPMCGKPMKLAKPKVEVRR